MSEEMDVSEEAMKVERSSPADFTRPAPGWWIAILAGMTSLGALACNARLRGWWHRNVTTILSTRTLRWMFGVAVFLHVAEAAFANVHARRNGLGNVAGRWTLQTLLLGFPSTRALLDRVRAGSEEPAGS